MNSVEKVYVYSSCVLFKFTYFRYKSAVPQHSYYTR